MAGACVSQAARLTAEAHALVRFRRALERRALWAAEDAAREMPDLVLEDALQLVHVYAERGSPKYERAAMRSLERYPTEGMPGHSTSRGRATDESRCRCTGHTKCPGTRPTGQRSLA
jgi:hypothetical protein